MTARIYIRPAAQHDLNALTDYFLAEVDPDMAGRFVEQARKSFNALLQTPGLGPPVPTLAAGAIGMRKWRVDDFRKILNFYQPLDDGVRIVRVLHAAADWWSILDVN